MKTAVALLLLGCLLATSQGQGIFGENWLHDMIDNMSRTSQLAIQAANQQFQNEVQAFAKYRDEFAKTIGQIENNPSIFSSAGASMIRSTNGSVSKSVESGTSTGGKYYYRATEDRIVDGILHHNETVFNPTTGKMEEYRFTLDTNDPAAKPVLLAHPK